MSLASVPFMPPESPTGVDQQLPCDFLEFLSTELSLERPAANALLGDWLVRYEAGPAALSHHLSAPRKSPRTEPLATPLERHAA